MNRKTLLKKLLLCPLLLLFCSTVFGQATVKGVITDEQGLPLPGVTVTVKGTTRGTNADINGTYSISASAKEILVFTMLGYLKQEFEVSDQLLINVKMQDEVRSLNEVVVIGYGTQRRRDITGSVASVKGDVFKNQPITNPTEALQGRVAGVDIVKSSGAPDARPAIIIRGLSSLNQPPPLYIVDGVRSPDGNNINVQDIESIEILKDASSAAIYGSAAAGGVILISTKKGVGLTRPVVNFNARYGVTKPKVITLLDKEGFIKLQNIINPAIFNGADKLDTLANTDWAKVLYRDASEQNYNLSVNGSTPVVNYLVSGFYNKQEGVYIRNFSNIYGGRVNTDFKLGEYIKIGEQVAVSQRRTSPPIGVEAQLHNAPFRSIPLIPLYNKNGSYGTAPTGYPNLSFSGPNPFGAVNSADAENFKNNFQGNVYAEIALPFHLSFRTTFGYNYYHETQDYFQDVFNFGAVANPNNSLNKQSVVSTQVLSNYVLNYNQSFGKHNISATAGFEQINGKYNNINVTESNIGLPGYSFVQTSSSGFSVNGATDNNALIKSYFGRINYNFNSRYYLSGSIRQDANFTVFGPNKQKGVFPAASAGWNISEEPFFKTALPFVSNLKIRGSYGELGNSNIGTYNYLANYGGFVDISYNGSVNGQNFYPGAPLFLGSTYAAIPNPNLHWETVKETNIGLDGALMNDRLYFTLEWYNKKTIDMLYALPLSLSSGITVPYLTNVGSVSSKGVDILLGYRNNTGKLGFDISVTAGFNSNKVLSLSGTATGALYDGYNFYSTGDAGFNMMPNQRITISKAGLPFGSFYGYKALGIFATDADAAGQTVNGHVAGAGDLRFEDLDGNKIINDADRQVIGNPNPKMVYGISIRLNYKGFDMAMLFNGVAGVDLFNGVKAYSQSRFADGNSTSEIFNASFLGDNGLTDQPRIGTINPGGGFTDNNGNYTTVNSYFVESGSYLKLKNLQVGYTFSNGDFMKKAGVKNIRVFVMGNNLLTFTKYSGLDPELASAFSSGGYPGPTTRGIDAVSQYPQTRIYSAGIDFIF
jgi:TonB-linked SusC/RagA family outer membrane protein